METKTIQVKTIYGKLLTIKIKDQTEEFISGYDKFGLFVKIPLQDIYSSEPVGEVKNGN